MDNQFQADIDRLTQILRQSPPLIIGCNGDLGAGKSYFIRHLLRQYYNNTQLQVPSPSFTILVEYDNIIHADFYRIKQPNEIAQLGLEFYATTHHIIIEWYMLGLEYLPHSPDITIDFVNDNGIFKRNIQKC